MNTYRLEKEHRIEWADLFKGIMIILVVVGHSTGKFNSWIYQFHMAAFFFMSGYLSTIEKKNDAIVVAKKFLNIMLPYFVFGAIGVLINGLLSACGVYEFLFGSGFIGIRLAIKEMFLYGNVHVQYWGTFWFLIALFGIEILQLLFYQISGKKVNYVYFVLSLGLHFAGYMLTKIGITSKLWFIDINIVLITQLYYTVGVFFRKVSLGLDLVDSKIGHNILSLIVAVIIFTWGKMNGIVVDFASRNVNNPCGDVVVALASIYFVAFIASMFSRYSQYIKRLLAFFGKNSLGIMIFHFVFFKIFFVMLYKLGIAGKEEIANVVITGALSNRYWIVLSLFSIVGSVLLWYGIMKIPFIRVCLGQDVLFNQRICTVLTERKMKFLQRNTQEENK